MERVIIAWQEERLRRAVEISVQQIICNVFRVAIQHLHLIRLLEAVVEAHASLAVQADVLAVVLHVMGVAVVLGVHHVLLVQELARMHVTVVVVIAVTAVPVARLSVNPRVDMVAPAVVRHLVGGN